MKTNALIFAGGVGTRMNTKALPKQFLNIHGKPVIIHTIEQFDNDPEIDAICVVSVADWLDHMQKLVEKYGIRKVRWIVPGGVTALDSQYCGLKAIEPEMSEDGIVLIHDGVRPLINHKIISDCVASVKQFGSAVTVAPAVETIVQVGEDKSIQSTIPRAECVLARAPQCFWFTEILAVHEKARKSGKYDYIDAASMMLDYGYRIHTVMGPDENIKVTTPADFYICRALLDAREETQIYGL